MKEFIQKFTGFWEFARFVLSGQYQDVWMVCKYQRFGLGNWYMVECVKSQWDKSTNWWGGARACEYSNECILYRDIQAVWTKKQYIIYI